MPGISKDNIKISVSNNNELTIEGRQEEEKSEKNETVYRYERYKGNYRRTISMPDVCDIDNIEAKLEDGVLTLKVPKREPSPAREIKIG
jgi:HSP20 family protein